MSTALTRWRTQNGLITINVTSDGTTGSGWIARLAEKGYTVGNYAEFVLKSAQFVPTTGVKTEVRIFKGSLFTTPLRVTGHIREEVKKWRCTEPHHEVACLLRDALTDDDLKAMEISLLVVMHQPLFDKHRCPVLFDMCRYGKGRRFDAYDGKQSQRWVSPQTGFAFQSAVQ